jgi:hypothetical protein
MAIVGALVTDRGSAAAGRRLSEWLATGPLTYTDRLMDLVRELFSSGAYSIPADVVDLLVVVRRFDRRLLDALHDRPFDAPMMDELYGRIRELPFVEPNARPAHKEWLGHSSWELDYRVHNLVRTVLSQDLATRNPNRFAALHARALAHYSDEINKRRVELNSEDAFLDAVRYKDDRWRYLYGEWLHHLGQSTGAERGAARLAFAQVYFDAFWWWDYYSSRFRFCTDLLAEWFAVCQDSEDRELHDALLQFKLNFPVGYGSRRPLDRRWLAVRQSLSLVRERGSLDKITLPEDPELRQLRALTSLFLAEAAQSYNEDFAKAELYYADAQALFDGAMGQDWTRHQRAEMWLGTSREHLAADLLEGVEERARARRDPELLARLAMFTADRRLTEGQFVAAAEMAVCAVLHAFVFHIRQTKAPDDYSTNFHAEAADKAATVMEVIYDRATATEWSAVADRVRELLDPLTAYYAVRTRRVPKPRPRATASADLVALLPPVPTAGDGDEKSYVEDSRWARDELTALLKLPVSP